jgi:predicted ATPase/class 3 adenylate cyclase/DNA-binding CsgD family transcriptional regulator
MADPDGPPPSGIVAFVFTDIEDSTTGWEADPAAMRADVVRHRSLIDRAVHRHHGTRAVEQGAGDSTVAAFARASDAVAAAIDLQVAMHTEQWTATRPLRVRVAVHAGEVEADGRGRYGGPTLNRCGRLLHAAHGGQIVASASTIELGRASLPDEVVISDLGAHHLRGIDEPVPIVQVTVASLPSSFPPLRTIDGGAVTLPSADSSFIGRDADLATLAELIASHGLVTIVGAGGCGKTRLALEVARERLERFRDGALWVDLAPVTSAEGVVDAAATAIGMRGTTEPTSERVVARLAGRTALLVIDNCEHVIDDAATFVTAVRSSCPDVRVLATSREPLALRDEAVWRVPSLSVPDADGAGLLESGAGRLLLDRIRRVHPDVAPTTQEREALTRICRRLDGIPLAIELAAARTATIPLVALAERLDDRFSLLSSGGRDVLARQRTLEGSIGWSYQLLAEEEQRAFRRLGVFNGSFPVAAGVDVIGGDPRLAEDLLFRLLDCSLLADRTNDTEPRVHMLEAVRWFSRERLLESGEADDAHGRHLDWCVRLADRCGGELEGPTARAAVLALDHDIENLRAAFSWALRHGRADDVARSVSATVWFWSWRGRAREGADWLARAGPEAIASGDPSRLAVAYAGVILPTSSDPEALSRRWVEALALARELGDERTEGRLRVLACLHEAFDDPPRAAMQAETGRLLCGRAGDRYWEGMAVGGLALCQIQVGRFDLAEPYLDEMRTIATALGNPFLRTDEIARRCQVDRYLGRYQAVLTGAREIDELVAGLTELGTQMLARATAAFVDVAQGRADEALATLERMADRCATDQPGWIGTLAQPFAVALTDLGRGREAIDLYEREWAWTRQLSFRYFMGLHRAVTLLTCGDVERARSGLEDALEAARAGDNDTGVAITERYLAAIDRDDRAYTSAESRLHRALETFAAHRYPQLAADVLEELAGIDLDHGRPEAAATLFGATATIRDAAGVVRRFGRQAAYEADLAALERQLDHDVLESTWATGAALTLPDAVELARRGRGERGRPSAGWESLTATEAKVADLVAQGLTNPEVAARLIMGRATVKTHVSSILRKLELDNRTQLAGLHARRTAT